MEKEMNKKSSKELINLINLPEEDKKALENYVSASIREAIVSYHTGNINALNSLAQIVDSQSDEMRELFIDIATLTALIVTSEEDKEILLNTRKEIEKELTSTNEEKGDQNLDGQDKE